MSNKEEALNSLNEKDEETKDSEIMKEYRILGEKCDDVIKKIRRRKNRKN
jgi:hypothetical protein